jgi:hypothetical protein
MNQIEIDNYKENSYELYWRASFNELLSEAMIKKWSRFDSGTKFLSLVTVSGSVFASWFFWSTDEGKYVWSTIAVVVFIVSAANTSMKVPDRIKKWEERRSKSSEVVHNVESFRRLLRIYDNDEQIKTEYVNLENKWKNTTPLFESTDVLITNKISDEMKNKVNQNIKERRYNK